MLQFAQKIEDVTINDLYQQYPFFDIDIKREQELLLSHDIIIFQHPLYWYSTPAIIKQWQDLVLEHGWAYGRNGRMLEGKKMFHAITSGGRAESYKRDGYNAFTIQDFMRPVERTAKLCRMDYWPPYVIHGTHRLETAEIKKESQKYADILTAITKDKILVPAAVEYLNDLLPTSNSN